LDYRFKAEEWEQLTPAERIRRCRLLAAEAMTLGQASTRRLKLLYADISAQWTIIGDELEREMREGRR
jgi:hypothetical protein